jgi:hypothetical protein
MSNKVGLFYGQGGQGAPEFSVVTGFVLLIFLLVLIMVFQKQSETHDFQVFLDAKRVASIVSGNINMISQNGHGYYRYFSVPKQLYGYTDYNMAIADNFLEISYTGTTWSVQLPTNNVTIASLAKGDNETNCIGNYNGRIIINTTCSL